MVDNGKRDSVGCARVLLLKIVVMLCFYLKKLI